jgi:hypothetical protein
MGWGEERLGNRRIGKKTETARERDRERGEERHLREEADVDVVGGERGVHRHEAALTPHELHHRHPVHAVLRERERWRDGGK